MTAFSFSRRVLKTWSFRSIALVRLVGGDGEDVEIVDVLELGSFGLSGSGHAGELGVEAEVVLDGDGGVGLGLGFDLAVFLRFHGLMESVGPTAAGHFAAGVFVDDDDLVVLDDVFDVFFVETVGFEKLGDDVHLLALFVELDGDFFLHLSCECRRRVELGIDVGVGAGEVGEDE